MKTCVIACSSVVLARLLDANLRGYDKTMRIIETSRYADVLENLGAEQGEIFLFVENYLLGLDMEERIKSIFLKNNRVRVCCILLGKCEVHYGLKLVTSGVDSIVSDTFDERTFFQILETVFKCGKYYPPQVVEALERREHIINPQQCCALTEREKMVLDLMIKGKTIKETSGEFGCSAGTVANLRKRVLGKLGAVNNTNAVCIALNSGYCPVREEAAGVGEGERVV